MNGLVLDASMALAWCFADESSEVTDHVLAQVQAEGAVVPDLWDLEVGNVFVVAERRGRVSQADTGRMLALLESLPIETADDHARAIDLVPLARAHGLSVYDASYLHTAMVQGLPLATKDAALADAARAVGVPVVGSPPA